MAEMTGLERALTYLHGEKPDKMPIWHESVYLAWKYSGVPSLRQYIYDPEAIVRGHMKYAEKFKIDITGVNIDVWWMYEPFGAQVEILDHIIQPKAPPWRYKPDPSIYEKIEYHDPKEGERAKIVFKAWEIVHREYGDKILLRQGWFGPLAALGLIFGVPELMRDMMIFPEMMSTIEKAVRNVLMDWAVDFAKAMVEAMKPNVTNFCMCLSGYDKSMTGRYLEEILAKFDLEYLKKVREYVGKDVPITTHICGYDPDLDFIYEKFGKYINELQFHAPGSTYPLEEAVRKFGEKIPICAGIDHLGILFTGTPAEVERMVKNSIDLGKKCISFALGPGCGLGYGTPEENILAVTEARDKHGTY